MRKKKNFSKTTKDISETGGGRNMQRSSFKKNQNKPGLKIGLLVLGGIVLILAIGGGYVAYSRWQEQQEAEQRREEAEEVAHTYIAALEEQNMEQFVTLLNTESLQEEGYEPEELKERYEAIFSGIGASEIQASEVLIELNEEEDRYEFSYHLSMETSLERLENLAYQTVLVETEESVTVQWDHELIFPEMEAGDAVRLSYDEGQRGNIYDRYGNMIAGEGSAWQAGLHPGALADGEEREEQLSAIAEEFEQTVEGLEALLDQSWVSEESFVPITITEEDHRPELTGVMYQQTNARIYPLGEAAAHLTGYVAEATAEDLEEHPTLQAGDHVGKSGLEATFDEELRGTKGGRIYLEDQEGDVRTVLIENEIENGENIHLTIDSELQEVMYEQFEDDAGAVVVTDPASGEIIVSTSAPSYDPNAFARGITSEEYAAYEEQDSPFLARYSARYAPGSTFKAITAMIGLDTGVTTPDKIQTIEGLRWAPDSESWGSHQITRVSDAVTEVDLEAALVYSDNIYFAREALEMGAETFLDRLSEFPFGANMDLPISMQAAQISNSGELESEQLLADTAYGQGQTLMSPIHQAVFYSPVVNEGELVFPQLLVDEENTDTLTPVSAESANIVRDALIQNVEDSNGSGHPLADLPFAMGAKTGTAEIMGDEGENVTNGFLYAFDAQDNDFSFVGFLEGHGSGDVVDRFTPVMSELKSD